MTFQQSQTLKIGIVGARDWSQERQIEFFMRDLPTGITVVSGGANGVDKMAAYYCRQYGLPIIEILPDLSGCKQRHEFTEAYYKRNQLIVDEVDFLVAFTNKDHGGTWDTIRRAQKKGIPVRIFKPAMFIGYPVDIPEPKLESTEKQNPEKHIGDGPFAIKRVSLGSYALKLRRYMSTDEWASFSFKKDTADPDLIDIMVHAFVGFFKKYHPGKIDLFTIPPRSIRNIEKPHIMDEVLRGVGIKLNIEVDCLFLPWDKKGRGRFAQKSNIEISDNVKRHIGKVCYVLDDVSTSNYTLQQSVVALNSLSFHAHGVAYILM